MLNPEVFAVIINHVKLINEEIQTLRPFINTEFIYVVKSWTAGIAVEYEVVLFIPQKSVGQQNFILSFLFDTIYNQIKSKHI